MTEQIPNNAAADQIVRAQSIMTDLTTQLAEIQSAIARQQALVDALVPLAVWSTTEYTAPEDGSKTDPASDAS